MATDKDRARWQRYNTSPKGRERARNYRLSVKGLEAKRRYRLTPKGRETQWQYRQEHGTPVPTPEARRREAKRRRDANRERVFDSTRPNFDPIRAARLAFRRRDDD